MSVIFPSKVQNSESSIEVNRLIRSINSFVLQQNKGNELIIISKDCEITKELYYNYYKNHKNIKLLSINSNTHINEIYLEGINFSQGKFITHLNSDIIFTPQILNSLSSYINDWSYVIDKFIYIPFDFSNDNMQEETLVNNQNILFKRVNNNFYNLDSLIYTKEIGNKYWKEANNKEEFVNKISNKYTNTSSIGMHCICEDNKLNIHL